MIVMLLGAALLVLALVGPTLVRRSSPLLVRAPRLSSALLLGGLAVWLASAAAVSVVLAGLVSGPQLLPAPIGDVCRRCLAAASPLPVGAPIEIPVPAAVLLLLPLGGTLTLIVIAAGRLVRRARSTRAFLDEVSAVGRSARIAGRRVALIPDQRPVAFSLPSRRGGIVLSRGLLEALDPQELAAVVEHEETHLRQHHHLMATVLHAVAGPLRAIPLARAVTDTVPHLLEVAADDSSRHRCGTPALASALLTLGSAPAPSPAKVALHATGPAGPGPDRIGHLVAPAGVRSALAPTGVMTTLLVLLLGAGFWVYGQYALVVLGGCTLPL